MSYSDLVELQSRISTRCTFGGKRVEGLKASHASTFERRCVTYYIRTVPRNVATEVRPLKSPYDKGRRLSKQRLDVLKRSSRAGACSRLVQGQWLQVPGES